MQRSYILFQLTKINESISKPSEINFAVILCVSTIAVVSLAEVVGHAIDGLRPIRVGIYTIFPLEAATRYVCVKR